MVSQDAGGDGVVGGGGAPTEQEPRGAITGTDYSLPAPTGAVGGAKPMPDPQMPSAAEVARHMLTHLP